MRKLMIILKIVFIILLILNTFIGIIAQGSGHNIPLRTNLIFGIVDLLLVALIILTIYLGRKKIM